ncbi:hypothetical protein ACLOJK_034715 [Asimina triloba]
MGRADGDGKTMARWRQRDDSETWLLCCCRCSAVESWTVSEKKSRRVGVSVRWGRRRLVRRNDGGERAKN